MAWSVSWARLCSVLLSFLSQKWKVEGIQDVLSDVFGGGYICMFMSVRRMCAVTNVPALATHDGVVV
jgi:hypothetical protein